jgi:putative transcriptional regulator
MPYVKITPDMVARAEREVDWTAIDALTDHDVAAQVAGNPNAAPLCNEAESAAGMVRFVRGRLGLSQSAFSARFHIPVATLRDWEQGRRRPDRPTLAYLRVINREPEVVARALSAAS